ncbi:AmmeMemoRadiSam system protein B [bacterium]|nr:AmmeMemoRadiSam system protein B [bacterium]
MARKPAVAGMFYEADEQDLIRSIEKCFVSRFGPGKIPEVTDKRIGRLLGLVCPHAGYIYSGQAAAHAYFELAKDGLPDIAIILGPNHHGLGAVAAVGTQAEWITPLGSMQVDLEVAGQITRLAEFATSDDSAHVREHSVEVQLPFLQYISRGHKNIRIVPITLAYLNKPDALLLTQDLGNAIAQSIKGKSAVIIASSDLTHYESRDSARAKDTLAIDHVLNLDPEGLIETVYDRSITMCGVLPTAVMLHACKVLGATGARKLAYYSSGDITGEVDQVVGYGALSVEA